MRSTYELRSSTNNVNPTTGTRATDHVMWLTGSGANDPFYPVKLDASASAIQPFQPQPMFRMSKLKNRAIVSDIHHHTQRVDRAHVKGFNVLYANGGAKWVTESLFSRRSTARTGT